MTVPSARRFDPTCDRAILQTRAAKLHARRVGATDPGGDRAYLLRAAGRPDPGVELRVVDPNTLDDVPTGDVGEILVRSTLNMKGYWKLPEETPEIESRKGCV